MFLDRYEEEPFPGQGSTVQENSILRRINNKQEKLAFPIKIITQAQCLASGIKCIKFIVLAISDFKREERIDTVHH
jgi:hypothetical protein